MKKKYLYGLIACMMASCQSQQQPFEANQELDYCTVQINKALEALQDSDGTYDYTMEPRNILASGLASCG